LQTLYWGVRMDGRILAILMLERKALNKEYVSIELLEQIPNEYLMTSPTLMYLLGEHLFNNGQLFEAKKLLINALKVFSELSLHRGFLSTLALLSQLHLRLGNTDESNYYLNYLQEEYHRGETKVDGIVPLTLALGTAYLKGTHTYETYMADSISIFRENDDMKGMGIAIFEFITTNYEKIPKEQRRLLLNSFEQQFKGESQYLEYRCLIDFGLELQHLQFHEILKEHNNKQLAGLPIYYQYFFNLELPVYESVDLAIHFLFNYRKQSSYDNLLQLFQSCKLPLHKRLLEHLEINPIADKSEMTLSIFCFGEFKIISNQNESLESQWKRRKSLEILVYLLLQKNYSVSKEKLMEALFPNGSPSKISVQVRVAIHYLNQVIYDKFYLKQFVQTRGGNIYINRNIPIQLDISEYEDLLFKGDKSWSTNFKTDAVSYYEKMYPLYHTFLEGYDFQDWIEEVRKEFKHKQIEVLRRLAHYYIENNELLRAEYYLIEAIRIDSTNERIYQELITLLLEQNNSYEAFRWQRKLDDMLRNEYDFEMD